MLRAPDRTAGRRRAFTLIEMLAVLFIMAILVALTASVSSWVTTESNRRQTREIMGILQQALQVYYDTHDEYPDDDGGGDTSPGKLYEALKDNSKALMIIRKLPEEAIGNNTTFCDAWGNVIRYEKAGGFGNQPVLISAGPDMEFGDDGDDQTKDNIRSDQP